MSGRIPDHRHEGPRCPFCTEVGKFLRAQDIAVQWIVVLETFELLGKEVWPEPALTQALVDAGTPRSAVPSILARLLERKFTASRLGPLSKLGAETLAKIREAAGRPPAGPPGGS